MIYTFNTLDHPTLTQVGGKALSLIDSTRAGFTVPEGFVLSVAFFKPWMDIIEGSAEWATFVETPSKENCDVLKEWAAKLTFTISQKKELAGFMGVYEESDVFAVRSSSPEEDLEGTSFAGQYETVLGATKEKLYKAVATAYASMYDTRVVEYKKLNGMAIDAPKIAVVVQQMIPSEISGVAFSLNPQNNAFDEVMINASFGLGETIVSGVVTPDTYVVDKVKKEILSKQVNEKMISLHLLKKGGTTELVPSKPKAQALTDDQIFDVASLAQRCEDHYGKPMDIEWAIHNETLYLLQARPVTTHIPFPDLMLTAPGEPKNLYLDLAVLTQGFTEPFSVLGIDIWTRMLDRVKMGMMFEGKEDGIIFNVHGRQYLNLSHMAVGMGLGGMKRTVATTDPSLKTVIEELNFKEDYMPKKVMGRLKTYKWTLAKMAGKMFPGVIKGLLNADKALVDYDKASAKAFDYIRNDYLREAPLDELVDDALDTFGVLADLIIGMFSGMTSRAALDKMMKDHPRYAEVITTLNMDLRGNPTSAMGYAMLKLAAYKEIQQTKTPEAFVEGLAAGRYSNEFMEAFHAYMYMYGVRGFKEIDVATPRTFDHPEDLFVQLKHLNIEDNQLTTVKARKQAGYEDMLAYAKSIGKEKKFKKLVNDVNNMLGYREDPKFFYVTYTAMLHKRAMVLGRRFVEAGRLDQAEDIFNLNIKEVARAEKDPGFDLRAAQEVHLAPRRPLAHVTNWPKMVDSRGKIHRHIRPSKDGDLVGDPIAAGIVTGRAKVLKSPYEKDLLPGEILVAKCTEPSWTPIFINATGVVLEIGGPLQHGAIIAREYGLPCVTGIDNVMDLIKDGDLLEVDGTSGIVRIIIQEDQGAS